MKPAKEETLTQAHIRELREQINSRNAHDIQPFTFYKIITYFYTIFFPLVPLALYRLWCPGTEFSRREQVIWTAVIIIIAIYAIFLAA